MLNWFKKEKKRNVRAFVGSIGSGKGYKCDKLKEQGYIKLDFADCLREMVWRMLNWEPKTPEEYDNFKKGKQYISNFGYLNGRLVLQKIGQAMRCIDENFWVKQWTKSIDKLFKMGYDNIMVSDARYENEIEAIKSIQNANIKIEFCDYHSDRYDNKNTHESEQMAQEYLSKGYKDGDIIYER